MFTQNAYTEVAAFILVTALFIVFSSVIKYQAGFKLTWNKEIRTALEIMIFPMCGIAAILHFIPLLGTDNNEAPVGIIIGIAAILYPILRRPHIRQKIFGRYTGAILTAIIIGALATHGALTLNSAEWKDIGLTAGKILALATAAAIALAILATQRGRRIITKPRTIIIAAIAAIIVIATQCDNP